MNKSVDMKGSSVHLFALFFQKKTRLIAYKICSNVQIMIRDLCRSPPSFKSNVILSWKPTVRTSNEFDPRVCLSVQEELKRSISETEGGASLNKNGAAAQTANTAAASASAAGANKRARPEKPLYKPPTNNQPVGQKNRRGGYQRY